MKKKDLKALFDQLASGVEDDADIADDRIATTLQKDAHPVFQVIYDRGHGAATDRSKHSVDQLESDLADARSRLRTAEDNLRKAREENPDADQIRKDHEKQMEELRDQHKNEVKTLTSRLMDERRKRINSDLKAKLTTGERRLDPDYAEVQIQKAELQDRLTFPDEKSDRLEVLQAGKTIPIAAADGTSPLDILAEELKEAAPPKFVEVSTGGGSGSRGDRGSDNGGGKGSLSNYREKLEKERESQNASADAHQGAKRMGVAPAG